MTMPSCNASNTKLLRIRNTMKSWMAHLPQTLQWLVLALAFCLPFSTSAVTIIALLILLCWVVEGDFARKCNEIAASPICRALLVYVGVMVLGLFWSDSWLEGLGMIQHRWKILFLPILLTVIRWDRRRRYVNAFVGGVLFTVIVIDLAYGGVFQQLGITSRKFSFEGIVNHMVSTPMLAFVIYLLWEQILWREERNWHYWLLSILGCLLSLNIFIMRGRSGLFAFVVLMFLLSYQYFKNNILRALLVPTLIFPIIFVGAYYSSPVFQLRMNKIVENISDFDKDKKTSVGFRLHYWSTSWALIKEHPWGGVGIGDFASSYLQLNQQNSPEIGTTNNPHNQFIFLTAQLGIIGLVALLGLFLVFFREASRRKDGWERVRIAFPLFFMTIMLSESYLDITGTGFLYSLFGALLFKAPLPAPDLGEAEQGQVPNANAICDNPSV